MSMMYDNAEFGESQQQAGDVMIQLGIILPQVHDTKAERLGSPLRGVVLAVMVGAVIWAGLSCALSKFL